MTTPATKVRYCRFAVILLDLFRSISRGGLSTFFFFNNGLIYALIIDSFVTRKVPPDLRQPSSLV